MLLGFPTSSIIVLSISGSLFAAIIIIAIIKDARKRARIQQEEFDKLKAVQQALHEVEKLYLDGDIGGIIRLFDHAESIVRIEAIRAIEMSKDESAIEHLIRLLTDNTAEVRSAATSTLATMGQTKWRDWFLGDDQDFKRLGSSGDEGAEDVARHFGDLLETDAGRRLRANEIVAALIDLNAEASVPPLGEALNAVLAGRMLLSADVQESVTLLIDALRQTNRVAAVVPLVSLLRSRSQLANQIFKRYKDQTKLQISPSTGRNEMVDAMARAAIADLQGRKQAQQEADQICVKALEVINHLGDKSTIEPLVDILERLQKKEEGEKLQKQLAWSIEALQSGAPRGEHVCDVCRQPMKTGDGYCLTTSEVVRSSAYWEAAFRDAPITSQELLQDAVRELYHGQIKQMCSQETGWLVCEACIQRFPEIDIDKARVFATEFWEQNEKWDYCPPGAGSVDTTEAAIPAAQAWKAVTGNNPPE